MTKKLLTLIALVLSIRAAAQDSMPIIAYMGVPNDKASEANYKAFRDCGFDVSLYGYASLDQLVHACRIAEKCGVQVLGHCPETHRQPEQAAKVLMKEKGFFGYVLQDEPSADRIAELQREMTRLKTVDSTHCFYMNLLPNYGNWILQHTKTKTYDDYVSIATKTLCKEISFDFYPITNDGLRENWFANLETIRRSSLQCGKPFWGFILSVPHAIYPQPTLSALRLQAYVNLAYGAQALQYFTYWTPNPDSDNVYYNGPIDKDGSKTATYTLVQKMNRELRPIADLFLNARVTAVNHLGNIPEGTTRLSKTPAGVRSIKVEGSKGVIVSQFQKDGHAYMAIVNKNHLSPATLSVRLKSGVLKLNKDLTTEQPKSDYVIQAGDILLFQIK